MGFLPTSLGLRPRLALEVRAEGVIAARSNDAEALVSAVSAKTLGDGVLARALASGRGAERGQVVAAIRQVLEAVALKERQTTLILPDSAVRVLLVDFDSLPAKAADALPIVRFRLKKLLPFDADEAVVSYQVMSQERGATRVLAAAVPKTLLSEYEGLVREAGFEPGAVLSSTLAVCAGMEEEVSATLLVNAGESGVTTAIVQGGVLLLHRTVDLVADDLEEKVASARASEDIALRLPAELLANPNDSPLLPLVDFSRTEREWTEQVPLSGYGVIDDRHFEETSDVPGRTWPEAGGDSAPVETVAPVAGLGREERASVGQGSTVAAGREIAQAVSVAAAYFEDTLGRAPGVVVAAGTYGAEALGRMLHGAGFSEQEMRLQEAVDPAMLADGASTGRTGIGWMAGVRGALRS